MSFDASLLADRRRLKRRLGLWQAFAVSAVITIGLVVASRHGVDQNKPAVAHLAIEGVIVNDTKRLALINSLMEDDTVKGLIVYIDSPGGTFTGGHALYRTLREFAAKKPLVAQMGGIATSAGYMIAAAADHIVADAGTITGSIGVLMQTANMTELLGNVGIKPEIIKSSPLKAQPNPLEPFTDDARTSIKLLLADLFDQFSALVSERRKLSGPSLAAVADARVLSGRQAKPAGLIDSLGGEAEAREWLSSARGVDADLPVKSVTAPDDDFSLKRFMDRASLLDVAEKTLLPERLRLDGVLALWHPSLYSGN